MFKVMPYIKLLHLAILRYQHGTKFNLPLKLSTIQPYYSPPVSWTKFHAFKHLERSQGRMLTT